MLLELVRDLAAERVGRPSTSRCSVFGREELPASEPLPAFFEGTPLPARAALAILLEPTDGTIEAGCVGNLNARLVFHGTSAHSAVRGRANAISKAVAGLREIAASERREAVVGGLAFYEVLTRHAAPRRDRRQRRFGPCRRPPQLPLRTRPDARERRGVHSLAGSPAARGSIAGDSPRRGSSPTARSCEALRAAGDLELRPKQAWTNVADFTSRGLDAVNFGPGSTFYTHKRDERVEIASLVRVHETLRGSSRVASSRAPLPILRAQATYPFVRLDEARRAAEARGVG